VDDSKTERAGFRKGRVPLKEAQRLAEHFQNQLYQIAERVSITGSVLRKAPFVGDVDLLIFPRDLDKTMKAFQDEDFKGDDRIQRKVFGGILVEIYIAHRERELGALKLYTTGDIYFVRMMREAARDFGLELTPYGLYERGSHKPVLESPYERDYFQLLGMPYTTPENRTTHEKVGPSPSLGDRHLPPMEWSPFWKKMTTPPKGKKMFPGIEWDLVPWRAPDFEDEGKKVWYGPEGIGGEDASVIMYQDGGWTFGEYKGVTGLIENPQEPILSIWTFVSFEDLARAILEKSMVEVPLDAFQRSPDAWASFAAVVGAVKIAYYGGTEEFVSRLP
jgi:hypothetical protein